MQHISLIFSGSVLASSMLFSTAVLAGQPIQKLGPACPFGYRDEPKSGYCVPMSSNAKPVVPSRNGICPSGFHVAPKTGYCVSNN